MYFQGLENPEKSCFLLKVLEKSLNFMEEERQKTKIEEKRSAKRKNLDELTNEKKHLCADIQALEVSCDEVAQSVESSSSRERIVKFNVF